LAADEPDKGEAKPVAKAGPRQQQYTDNQPSRNDVIPLHQLLRDFPDKAGEANDAGAAVTPDSPKAVQPAHAKASAPRPGTKHNGRRRKAAQRKATRRNKH
jgi:hypothetical protein